MSCQMVRLGNSQSMYGLWRGRSRVRMSSRGVVAWAYCETVLLPTAGQREQTPSLDLKVMMGWTVLNLVLEASHGLVPIPLQTHHRHLCAMLATTCATSELLGCASRY